MSLRVDKEGTMRILKFSDNYFPLLLSKAGNGTRYKLRSGTMTISGSSSNSPGYRIDEQFVEQS